jgi:uncharacterized protein
MPGYGQFHLVLMVTSECTLRCDYCYVGRKSGRVMAADVGQTAIDRAIGSLRPGGSLDLGFFGGEPLMRAELIAGLADHARRRAREAGPSLRIHLTTNGTISAGPAWDVMLWGDLSLAVSCDGLPAAHDRHRRAPDGRGSSPAVLDTLRRLVAAGKDVSVVLVVRPDTVNDLPAGLTMLREMGVRFAEPSLDLWTQWSREDMANLGRSVAACADLWRERAGQFGIGWFDTMAARLAGLPMEECARCAFGAGEIAVSPAGNLYPCERLIGEDGPGNPHRLRGHAKGGVDFLGYGPQPPRSLPACEACTIRHACSTTCRCSNYVRTGDITRPDGLLCQWNQMCFREVSRVVLGEKPSGPAGAAATTRTAPANPAVMI